MEPSSYTSSSDARRRLRLPFAAALSVLVCAALSLMCWVGLRSSIESDAPVLLYVGDSFTGNYRFAPGERLEDITPKSLPPTWQVRNYAWPGARTLDILLQVQKAQTLLGHVDRIVLPLFVNKFMVAQEYVRLDKRGDNLKWLHLDQSALPILETFDSELTKKLVIHKIGLLMGFYDLLEYAFVQYLQWPDQRKTMWDDPPSRRAKIDAKNLRRAEIWDKRTIDPPAVVQTQAAQDLELLVDYLKEHEIPLLILWLPPGDMEIARARFSPRAQKNLQTARAIATGWSRDRGVESVDLVDALPGAYYDDFTHLKDVRGNQIIVDSVAGWISNH